MTETIEATKLQKRLEQLDYYQLKRLLREMELSEDFEICRMIQDRIDELVKNGK